MFRKNKVEQEVKKKMMRCLRWNLPFRLTLASPSTDSARF